MKHANRLSFYAMLPAAIILSFGANGDIRALAATFSLKETTIPIRQIDLEGVKSQDPHGYPRIDWAKFQREKPPVVERPHQAVILENSYLRLTLLPEMGRVYSLYCKATAHEEFWTNKIAKPIPALNDTGWWIVLGGVEYTIPRGEHGTTWSLPWKYQISEDTPRRKTVTMTVLEPQTKIEQTLKISISPGRAYYEAEIILLNRGDEETKFSHWVNPMWAPGGRGELTPETELVVPCTAVVVLDRDFNHWMLGSRVQEYGRNPLRFVKHWRSIGDLLAQQLTDGFYGAFSHDANEGIVRVFDPKESPGLDIWTWGFPPPPERQREFSEVPNLGYVEMWGGTSRDFSDEARGTLDPQTRRTWKEWMYPFHGTSGLTYANQDVAVNLAFDPDKKQADLGIFVTSSRRGSRVELRMGKTILLARQLNLSPLRPFLARVQAPPRGEPLPDLPELTLVHRGRTLARIQAKLVQPLQWNSPYLPENAEPAK